MNTEQAKDILKQAMPTFSNLPEHQQTFSVTLFIYAYNMGYLDGTADKTTQILKAL